MITQRTSLCVWTVVWHSSMGSVLPCTSLLQKGVCPQQGYVCRISQSSFCVGCREEAVSRPVCFSCHREQHQLAMSLLTQCDHAACQLFDALFLNNAWYQCMVSILDNNCVFQRQDTVLSVKNACCRLSSSGKSPASFLERDAKQTALLKMPGDSLLS